MNGDRYKKLFELACAELVINGEYKTISAAKNHLKNKLKKNEQFNEGISPKKIRTSRNML